MITRPLQRLLLGLVIGFAWTAPLRAEDCNTNGLDDADELSTAFEDHFADPDLPFPDNVETTDTINVNSGTNGDVHDLNVGLDVTHPFMGHTQFWLDSPDGTTVVLMFNYGIDSGNAAILFDDQAEQPLPVEGPLFGTFMPQQSLATFALDEASRDGPWTIHCLDTFTGSGTGVLNAWSLHFTRLLAPDCNTNSEIDACEIAGGSSADCNTDAIPDACQLVDCNSNGQLDICDAADGAGDCNFDGVPDECQDCDTNGAADECDLLGGSATDCNTNGALDECELGAGSAFDCDTNQLPDDCDHDCNTNAVADECDLAGGTAQDCNTNAQPDACELDCNSNGTADACDTLSATSLDCNTNEVPDECDGSALNLEWDNGVAADIDGLRSQIGGGIDGETADDFELLTALPIVGATFTMAEDPEFDWNGIVHVGLYADENGAPSDVETAGLDVNNGQRTMNGTILGRPRWDYSLTGLDLPVPYEGRWWISLRPNTASFQGSAFWITSDVPGDFGASYFRSSDLGYLQWTPTEGVTGADYDFAFTLTFGGGGDCNTNGQFDPCDFDGGISEDCDTNNVPDECQTAQTDCNSNGQLDACEAASSDDCNTNQLPDDCEDCNTNGAADVCDLAARLSDDCNLNGAPDECDLAAGSSDDCDSDLVPDECQPDCNDNNVSDACDVTGGTSNDANTNGVPDECENDCNTNGVADESDLQSGTSLDCNTNNVADECDVYFIIVGEQSPVAPILDFLTVESTIGLASGSPILDVDVCIDIVHTFTNDLVVQLAKAGTTVILADHNGGSGDNFAGTCFNDEAAVSIGNADPPFTGEFKPILPLAAFDGQPAAGDWVLLVSDASESETGTLLSWTLHVAVSQTDDCNANGVPDECEPGEVPDCNTNGIGDGCEGVGDCNTNASPDTCDIQDGFSSDCNTNATPDECEIGLCGAPAPDWDNGSPNDATALQNQIGGLTPAECADDFDVPGPTVITQLTFSDVEDTSYIWNGTVRVSTWANDAGKPSEAAFDTRLVPDDGGAINRVNNGSLFGRPRWDYTIETQVSVAAAGVNWFSATPASDGDSGDALWLSSHTPPEFGESFFRSAFFGFPNWTSTVVAAEQNIDFAFTLTFAECHDCNTNGALDECDIESGVSHDCQANGVPDECDIASGDSMDEDGDGFPDECDLPPCNTCPGDGNGNGIVDGRDIQRFVKCLLEFPPAGQNCGCTDLDADNDIDADDAMLLIDKLLTDSNIACP